MSFIPKIPVRREIAFSVFLSFFILNLATAAISNFEYKYFILKSLAAAFLLISMLIFLKAYHAEFKTFFALPKLKKLLTVLALVIIFPASSLIYSSNSGYGVQKIINFVVCSVPAVFAAYTIINIVWDKKLIVTSLIIIAAVIIISLTSVLIISPFDQTRVYHYEPGRWSHVFVGRLTSFLTLILFLILLNSKKRLAFLLIPPVVAGIILIYITGLRSAILGILIAGSTYLIYSIVKRKLLKRHYIALAVIIVFTSILIFSADYYLPGEIRTPARIDNMLNYENFNFGGEEGLQVRVKSAELAWEMFLNSPVIGNGYGSFKGYNNIRWASDQKYPHNIILEILSELGLVGLLFFGYIFYSITHSLKPVMLSCACPSPVVVYRNLAGPKHIHPITHSSIQPSKHSLLSFRLALLTLFMFAFWLALFSKDLSSQSLIWIFLAVVGEQKK